MIEWACHVERNGVEYVERNGVESKHLGDSSRCSE